MIDSKRVVTGYGLRVMVSASLEKSRKLMERLLALLGGGNRTAGEGFREDPEDIKIPSKEKLLEERKRKEKRFPEWNKAFGDKMVDHVYEYAPGLGEKSRNQFPESMFSRSVFGELKRKIGIGDAISNVDDAIGYIMAHLDRLLYTHHSGKKVRHESTGTLHGLKRGDPNGLLLRKVNHRFKGKVIKEIGGEPHVYEIRVEGEGMSPSVYRLDGTLSKLDLSPGQYDMEVSSVMKGQPKVQVEGAGKGFDVHPIIMESQLEKFISSGVVDFLQAEYPKLLGGVEEVQRKRRKIEKEIESIQESLKGVTDESKIDSIQEKIRLKEKMLSQLDTMSHPGISETDESAPEDVVPQFETEQTKKYRHEDTYKRWYNVKYSPLKDMRLKKSPYSGPLLPEPGVGFSDKDYSSIGDDLVKSVGRGELSGVTYREALPMMMDAIRDTPNPLKQKDGWEKRFIENMKAFRKLHKMPELTDARLFSLKDELIAGVREQILHDSRFEALKQNLVDTISRGGFKSAADAIEAKIRQAFDFGKVDELKLIFTDFVMGDVDVELRYKKVIEDGMLAVADMSIKKLWDIVRMMASVFTGPRYRSFMSWVRFVYLGELLHMEGSEAQKELDLFLEYKDIYPESIDPPKNVRLRDMIRKDLKKVLVEDPLKLKFPKQVKKERSLKVSPELSDAIIKDRDKDLMKQLYEIDL